MKLIFATNNKNKVFEINRLLGNNFEICTPADLGFNDDIPETSQTLEGNAMQKARFIYDKFKIPCFADDTGLEVEALNGAPGVYSARYAGKEKDSKRNMEKLLREMEGKTNRRARFRCVIAIIIDNRETKFEGIVNGQILDAPVGVDGFGYDPIFKPDGQNCSFAQMPLDDKNKISHRGRAAAKLVDFLKVY